MCWSVFADAVETGWKPPVPSALFPDLLRVPCLQLPSLNYLCPHRHLLLFMQTAITCLASRPAHLQRKGARRTLAIVRLSLFAAHGNDFGLCCFCTVISRRQALTATFSPPISGENIGIWVNRLNMQTKAPRGPPRLTCHSLGFARFQQALGMM